MEHFSRGSQGVNSAIVHIRLLFTIPYPDLAMERLVAIGFTAFAIEGHVLTAWPTNDADGAAITSALGCEATERRELTHTDVYADVIPAGTWEVAPGCWVISGEAEPPSCPVHALIRMPVGGGFGDGQHPATSLACALIAQLSTDGALTGTRVLDLGCGTGLLGVLAWKLGAARVDFSDVDLDSVRHTQACCAANEVTSNGHAAEVFQSDLLADLPERTYDLLIANLYGEFLVAMLGDLRLSGYLPRGRLVLSGISEGKRAMVESALDRAGFHIDRRLEHRTNDASWWGLLASR